MIKKMSSVLFLAGVLAGATMTSTLSFAQGKAADRLGWKLGAQAYTFNHFTLGQALEKMDSAGIEYLECYNGQTIGNGIDGKFDWRMDAAKQAEVKAMFKAKKKKLVAYGVVSPASELEWEQVFKFAKSMGIQVITAEPKREHWDAVSSLCDKYKIKVAIHDHPKPSHYWHPDSVLVAIQGRSKYMGACADIGHWVRSGMEPVDCIKQLKGHVLHLHFKDLNEKSRDAHDVIWGNGVCNMPAVLAELKSQGFKGMFSVEYEYNWDNSVPEVKESVKFWWDQVGKL
ncbi:sugar phosphate isomerase/epimerase family protein [Chitinophaga pinensis]|uniref:Sugar phosphate isomerase/epimerase n=1 Tax=Chitinophaga pinensis TaxID=79329 RepID=A0A5C6LPG1_9BACT|nr:sugar phosphate isomerase/epimerase [Chitinophaga pinensis]TWV99334.1 sugar phosphate isomerase/epimerase [Chitinophaga pinensis]